MVQWIDEPDGEDDKEAIECDICRSVFDEYPGATCPVCGEPLDFDAPDAQAVAHLEAAYEERTDYEGA